MNVITAQERESIVDEAVEQVLRVLPEIIGNLMVASQAAGKIAVDFYNKYPEFKGKEDIVQQVTNQIEGQDPTMNLEEILNKAVPEIRKTLSFKEQVDMEEVKEKPETGLKTFGDHGEL